jgi:CSLREA domain-containing protein
MQYRHLLSPLLPLLVLAACAERDLPTAPAEADGLASDHTPGHKVVNSLADPGNGLCNATQCTLREAINDPASTEISFAPGLSGTITLAAPAAGGGTLVIRKGLTITGPGTGIVIRRRATDPGFRIVRVVSGVSVRLTNLTIRGGATDAGGGILNFGTLRLTDSRVIANSGGGIDNHGTLTLTNSTVARNSGTTLGGGIINRDDVTLTLARSTVASNSGGLGGGIANLGGTIALTHSTVAHNSAFDGGGIYEGRGTATITNSRIVDNSASSEGGGIRVRQGRVTLINSTIARNSASDGGGIAARDGSSVTLTNSTVANNSATLGGGIFSNVQVRSGIVVTLTNSTVSGNSARNGGGIIAFGFLAPAIVSLTNSTVADNSATHEGGGINVEVDAFLRLTNGLVGRNSAPTGPDVLDGGGDISARFSLIGDGTGSGITNTDGNQVGSASEPIDPRLGPLTNNGGPTQTHALLLGSPAIDAASTPDCPSNDQRGVLRPQGPACDIGSFERVVQ